MSHTPGTWKRVLTGIFTDEDDPQIIAYCDDHRNRRARTPEEHIANANLLATAEDFLVVCEEDVPKLANLAAMVDPELTQQLMERVYDAIAKAKGEQ